MMGERTSVHSTWRPGTFVVCLWPVTCSHKMCWSRGIMMRKAQPVLGTPRLSSCEKNPGEAWTLSRQQMVTRFFRLKLSRAIHRRIYTMGRLRNCPACLLFWEVRKECLCRGFGKWRGPREAFTGKRGQRANTACPAGVCGWTLGGQLASQASALGTLTPASA